ncbi:glycoside hydrolase family 10 protein [Pontiella sp.]|uniref:glycoside hydrolase family 10 protein n=1 Tax=Pontiella sp. TaxID=2837462 RepID=UPI00356B0A25
MKRFCFLLGGLLAVTALVAVLFVVLVPSGPALPPVRALWVTRFDYDSPEDVKSIVRNVAEAGFTDVFFQIRGNGTAFYRSELEPWAHELSGGKLAALGHDPGWDPLRLAIDEAKPHGLRVHAYLNVLPGWKGLEDPPAAAKQLWREHPDWFMVDSLGQKMLPTSGWYAFVNPVLPEVRKHLRGIVKELCRYDVAGIHLDYIRYPHDYSLVARQRYPDATNEELLRHADFSYDAASLGALHETYGEEVTREQITEFRCDSVTRVVRDLSYTMQVERPGSCLLSAAVMGNPDEGKHSAFQDSGLWVRKGYVDWIVQMNYATKSFNRYLAAIKKAAGRRKFRASVVVGIYCKNDVDTLLTQIETVRDSGCRGLAVFSYSFLFDEQHRPTEKGRMLLPKLRP